ncbi:family 20 glycosylhydrolase [Massilia sp. Root335]|uniref:family 20 glycosylhydrolase n=1 Tax=Massilia sp. Root335 TaxID=1736517 RepID=UPI000A6CF656|nr:family 20 glycosylhydrolase [Massilia sp. Root335]
MPQREKLDGAAIAASWECVSNLVADEVFAARLTLTNVSGVPIAPGWTVYFNACRRVLPGSVSAGFDVEHLNGDLFALRRPGGAAWLPGETIDVRYEARFWAISVTDAPLGFYLVEADGRTVDLGDPEIVPFARPEQLQRHARDVLPPADAAWRWRENGDLRLLPPEDVGRITPTPVSARFGAERCRLSTASGIMADGALAGEAALLRALLNGLPSGEGARILLETGAAAVTAVAAEGPEAYLLDIRPDTILVRGAGAHGVFNGIQTLAQLLDIDGTLPCGRVLDAPRFGYRGLMLDVARHFASVATVQRLLDCMARYKLNRLHLHLTDDEGWRLHIDALPELTDIGSRRGIAPDARSLPPSFGSGADVATSSGTGCYGADDFIAILRYAHARHIEVIPEFNMPGHARAAVLAMRARHDRLRAQGDVEGAERYLLSDPYDASVYESVQLWRDNVICIALPSVDRFIDTVVAHVAALYREAGVPLRTIHTGGDEVPPGAWEGSPRCQALMRERGWTHVGQLHADFVGRCRAILARHGLVFAGWEETALAYDSPAADGNATPQPQPGFAGPGFQVYAWNNAWGSGKEDVAYRLANAGYDVVLANAANLYFDLAYAKDPQEPGYYWAGFVETRHAFGFCPLDMIAGAAVDPMGQAVPPERLAAMARLTPEGRRRIVGLQGQLWGENARTRDRIEYLAAPRLVALAERAWAPDPLWCAIEDASARAAAMDAAWNEFANRLGQRELARLDRAPLAYGYRLPPPGAVALGRTFHANVALPGLALHYTLDGSEPDAASPRYTGPVQAGPDCAVFKVATFDTRGRKSATVVIALDPHG